MRYPRVKTDSRSGSPFTRKLGIAIDQIVHFSIVFILHGGIPISRPSVRFVYSAIIRSYFPPGCQPYWPEAPIRLYLYTLWLDRFCPIFNIPDLHHLILFKIPNSCSSRYSNLHRANSYHSIHRIKTYHPTRNGFCVILIFSDHLLWDDTPTKVGEPTYSFALRSKSAT
jgi:hypothetical protein